MEKASALPDTSTIGTARVQSIDALRGFDMFWIVGGSACFETLFNYLSSPFSSISIQFEHCAWDGFRFYDLIFPLFLFIVGTSIPFATGRRMEQGADISTIRLHILRRGLTLFVFGLIYNGLLNFNFPEMRWMGVLQRIAICYTVIALIFTWTRFNVQVWLTGALLVGYWMILSLIPVPGFGAGNLTPEGNLAGYLDRLLLPGRFCCYEYGDNEGLMSTIPALATTLLGVLSGHCLRSALAPIKKVQLLVITGIGSLILAYLWGLVFPINKILWTSSYVLLAGGWSLLLMALFYWLIDVQGYKKWAFPFVVIGMNAITIYLCQRLVDFDHTAEIFVRGIMRWMGDFGPVFWGFWLLAVKWFFLYFLYRKKIFLKA